MNLAVIENSLNKSVIIYLNFFKKIFFWNCNVLKFQFFHYSNVTLICNGLGIITIILLYIYANDMLEISPLAVSNLIEFVGDYTTTLIKCQRFMREANESEIECRLCCCFLIVLFYVLLYLLASSNKWSIHSKYCFKI